MGDHELVRPSRDGDQFHYHWAARHCLALLPGAGDLVAVSIEGASVAEGEAAVDDGDELIDVGLYYGSEVLKDARLAHYVQLKHSTQHASKPWTASGIGKTLKGFAKRYAELALKLPAGTAKQKLRFSFTSNRPIAADVLEALEDLGKARAPRHPSIRSKLVEYCGLTGSELTDFFEIFTTEGGEPDLWAQRNLLAQDLSIYLADADYDSPVQLKELVTRKATSEFTGDPAIRRHDVLRALKASEDSLLPAPCLIAAPGEILPRAQEAEIRTALLAAVHPIVLHADGGVGKSVLAGQLARSLPIGSVSVLYDCFGDGLYRNSLHIRHRHRDALVQIANELAAMGLCHPLIPSTNADNKHFMRAFVGRLKQAIGLLRAREPEASLCLIVDAADNAQMAAEEHGDAAFVRDLIRAPLPDGVRLLFTCRTHRRQRLDPPPETVQIELRPFSLAETTQHLRRRHPQATDTEAGEFGFLSSSNPRVQALALSRNLPLDQMLRELGPQPSTVDRAISELLQRAIDKLKDQVGKVESAQLDLICQGLAVLRPLVPIPVLAEISGTSESAIRTFATELGRPLVVKGDSLHFLDEPAETWFRERFKPSAGQLVAFLACLKPLAAGSSYVASTLPQLQLSAGLMDELIELALSENGLPTTNPLERRDVQLQRLTFALKACLQKGRFAAAAKLALKAGGEAAGEARQTNLIQSNTDIAAALLSADRVNELVSRRTFGGNWMGAHHAYDAGLLSGRPEFLDEAGSRLRMAEDWLRAWSRLPAKEREEERVEDADRAEFGLAHLRVRGPESAVRFLDSWRPRDLAFPAAKRLARNLVDLGQFEQIDALAKQSSRNPWLMLGLALEASNVGHLLPRETLMPLVRLLSRSKVRLNDPTPWNSRRDMLEAVTAAISQALRLLPREDAIWAGLLRRYLPEKPPPELADRFGSDRSPLLRAYALEAALRGETLTLLAIAPPDVLKELESKQQYGKSSDTVAFERSTGGMLPWFVLGAEIACGRIPPDLPQAVERALKVSAAAVSSDYERLFKVKQVTAVEWLRTLRDASATDGASVETLRSWTLAEGRVGTDTLTSMCRIAARAKGLEALALELAVASYEGLERSQEHAEIRIDDYQSLARAIYPVSRTEAAAYFNRAVETSSKIGDENLARWSALLDLGVAAGKQGQARSRSAYRLARIAELTYEYVARDKHFDWQGTVDALIALCPPSTFTILSRWRDRDFGYAGRLLRKATYGLVKAGQLPAKVPVALSPFTAEWDELADVTRAIDAETVPDCQRQILQLRYHYTRVNPHSESTWSGFAELGRRLGADLPDIQRLLAAARIESITTEAAKAAKEESLHDLHDRASRKCPDWELLFAGVDLSDPDASRKAYADLRTFDPPYEFEEFYREGFRRSGPGNMADFVLGVAAWPDFGVFELRYLMDAVPASNAKPVSVRQALRQAVLAACRNTPRYSQRHGWGSLLRFERLLAEGIVTDKDVVEATLEGFAAQLDTLDAGELFRIVDPLASLLSPDEADGVLNFGFDLLEDALRPESGDGPWHEQLSPPGSCVDALAGYFWTSLGSPVAATRWEAAHAVRVCVELRWSELLSALASQAMAKSATPFVDERLVFYQWHAWQWLLIGLSRGALEDPEALRPFIPFLQQALKEEHVVIRHFAAQTLSILDTAGVEPAGDIAALGAVNAPRLPLAAYSGWRRGDKVSEAADVPKPDDDEEYFFGIDIGPYWFAPLGRAFGMDEESIERRAKQVLRERMNARFGKGRNDARYDRGILRGQDTSHSHGTMPRIDDLRAYHAYHAMMIVAARLLETRQVGKGDGDAKNDFEEWFDGQLLTRADGRWAADRRDPRLTEAPPKPLGYDDKTWCWSMTADYLDRQLQTDDGLQVLWGEWSAGHRDDEEDVSIHSALVSKESAAALLAALQTGPDMLGNHLPNSDDHDETHPEGFQLRGWVQSRSLAPGMDEYDPWGERLNFPGPRPDATTIAALHLNSADDGRRWLTPMGAGLRAETWTRISGLGRESEVVPGTRLSCDRSFLVEVLKAHPDSWLVLSVSVRRRPTRGNTGEDEYETYVWPYLRYYLIGDDGIARSL